jgi:hypothetical protein
VPAADYRFQDAVSEHLWQVGEGERGRRKRERAAPAADCRLLRVVSGHKGQGGEGKRKTPVAEYRVLEMVSQHQAQVGEREGGRKAPTFLAKGKGQSGLGYRILYGWTRVGKNKNVRTEYSILTRGLFIRLL